MQHYHNTCFNKHTTLYLSNDFSLNIDIYCKTYN